MAVTITLNGDPYDVAGPLTVGELLARLEIDPRRVAVEHNLIVLKRATFDNTTINAGDQIEIVNFVGGGASNEASPQNRWKTSLAVPGESSLLVARPLAAAPKTASKAHGQERAAYVMIHPLEDG